MEHLTLIGAPPSPYTRKMIALMRYRHIPYNIVWGDPQGMLSGELKNLNIQPPKPALLPTFILPDEKGILKVDASIKSVIVDMAGNREILGTLHKALGDKMVKCLTVGMTHWDNETTAEDLLGQAMNRDRTEFFFAPAHIQKRIGDWGQEGYSQKTNEFMTNRAIQSKDWMKIKETSSLENFVKIYDEVVSGNINPNEGIIINLEN
jgi:hypothetical protein